MINNNLWFAIDAVHAMDSVLQEPNPFATRDLFSQNYDFGDSGDPDEPRDVDVKSVLYLLGIFAFVL